MFYIQNVMSSPNQYLVYTALVLGSIGAYGTLNAAQAADVDELLNGGAEVSSTDLTSILSSLSKKVDGSLQRLDALESSSTATTSTTTATTTATRLGDVESIVDTLDVNFSVLDGLVQENISDISFLQTDFQDQISTNKSTAAGFGTTADTNLSTITEIIQPDLETLFGNVEDLIEADVGLDTRIGVIEEARSLEALTLSTMSDNISTNATDITTNLTSINGIISDLEFVFTENISNNEANIVANRDDLTYLQDGIRRVEEVDDVGEIVDEYVVCYPKFKASSAEIALSGFPLRLGNPADADWQLYKAEDGRTQGYGFSNAMRMRVFGGASTGFLVENHNDEALFSVRGSDALTCIFGSLKVDGEAYIHSNEFGACFSHLNYTAHPAIVHNKWGDVVLDSENLIVCRSQGVDRIRSNRDKVEVNPSLDITNGDDRNTTHFNFAGKGENYISSETETNFRFGNRKASVVIKEKEVYIDGNGVLAKLNSLQNQIDTIKSDSTYVKTDGTEYWIKGHKNDKNGNAWGTELGYDKDDARWHLDNTRMYLKFYKK